MYLSMSIHFLSADDWSSNWQRNEYVIDNVIPLLFSSSNSITRKISRSNVFFCGPKIAVTSPMCRFSDRSSWLLTHESSSRRTNKGSISYSRHSCSFLMTCTVGQYYTWSHSQLSSICSILYIRYSLWRDVKYLIRKIKFKSWDVWAS